MYGVGVPFQAASGKGEAHAQIEAITICRTVKHNEKLNWIWCAGRIEAA